MTSTRERIVADIKRRHLRREDQISALPSTNIIAAIPDDEWAAMHVGKCVMCPSEQARLYPTGRFCDTHRPRQ